LRAGQTNLSKTLTSELLPEVPLSGDQAGDMLNLSVQNKQKTVHPVGRVFKGAGFPSVGEMEGLTAHQKAYKHLGREVGPHC